MFTSTSVLVCLPEIRITGNARYGVCSSLLEAWEELISLVMKSSVYGGGKHSECFISLLN